MAIYHSERQPAQIDSCQPRIKQETNLEIAMTLTALSRPQTHRMDLSYVLDAETRASQAARWDYPSVLEAPGNPLSFHQESAYRLPPMRITPPEVHKPALVHWQTEDFSRPTTVPHSQPQATPCSPSFRLPSQKTPTLPIRRKAHSISFDSEFSSSPSPTFSSSPYRSPKHRISKSHVPHSNKAYPVEQVDWIRYHHDDCGMAWAPMFEMFHRVFQIDIRTSDQCLSSRYYRDNMVPMVDENRNLMFDGRGKLKWLQAKVRDRSTPRGRALCIPFYLVDKHPERAMGYDFVSLKDKERARQILAGSDPTDPEGKKARWRRIMREAELAGHIPPPLK